MYFRADGLCHTKYADCFQILNYFRKVMKRGKISVSENLLNHIILITLQTSPASDPLAFS